jgi:hypothetical protein
MSGELEAAGALGTAGLAAGALEGREPHRAGEGACLNCGAALSGRFCGAFGQPAHVHRSLLHLLEEVLHGLFHFDTKAWRTLPLLAFRPGTLTRNYIYGKRARYISPLALFLFTIFFMFFVFAFASPNVVDVRVGRETRAEAQAQLARARTALAEAQREVAQAEAESAGVELQIVRDVLASAEAEVRRRERRLAIIDGSLGPSADNEPQAVPGSEPENANRTWQEEVRRAAREGRISVRTPFPQLNARILHSFENPDLALYKVLQAAYKFSFLLVPISLPFIWLLFLWRRGLTLYDHTVFTLYSLSYASLVFVLVALVNDIPFLEWVGAAVLLAMPFHMYFHLKGAYALSWWSALWRVTLLLVFAVLALSVFAVAIILLGLGG